MRGGGGEKLRARSESTDLLSESVNEWLTAGRSFIRNGSVTLCPDKSKRSDQVSEPCFYKEYVL